MNLIFYREILAQFILIKMYQSYKQIYNNNITNYLDLLTRGETYNKEVE